jgi:hypothetical protein
MQIIILFKLILLTLQQKLFELLMQTNGFCHFIAKSIHTENN